MSIRYMKKCSTVYKCKGNTNQSHNEISSHTCKDGYYLKKKRSQELVRMWKNWNLCALLVEIQNSIATMVNRIKVLQKKIELPYDQAIPLLGIYPKELKPRSQRNISTSMFITPPFMIAKV